MDGVNNSVNIVFCPLVDSMIDAVDCAVNQDVSERMLKPSATNERYLVKDDWRDICLSCKNHAE